MKSWRSILSLLLIAPLAAAAADITVSRLDDPLPDGCGVDDCSLREAVLFANGAPGPDRILLPASASPYLLTRVGASEDTGLTGDLDVIGALEIAGQGASAVVITQAAVDRILHLQGIGAPTTLRNVHLQGGRGVTQGGAVFAEGAQLLVVDSEFSGNVATTFVEFEILNALARSPGRVFTRDMLLARVWGDSAYRDPRTIDVHIRHLREKIEVDPKEPEYLFTVRGVGYRFRDED